jgi:hypothetical protein
VLLEVEVIGFLSDILSSQAFAELTTPMVVAPAAAPDNALTLAISGRAQADGRTGGRL